MSAEYNEEATIQSLIILYQMNMEKFREATAELTEENESLASENRRLIIEVEDARHQASSKELALKEAYARIQMLEEELRLQKQNPMPKEIKNVEVLAMASPPSLEPFGPDFSIPDVNRPDIFDQPYTDGTVLLVDINTATERELRMIPGVGVAMAKRIINHRPYDSVWALMKLEGMGKKRVVTLQQYVTVE